MIIDKIRNKIKRQKLFKKNDKVLVGVSGGPDSVFLLYCLLNLKDEYGFKVSIAHINHCTRKGQSDLDERFVRDLAIRFKLPFFSIKSDVKEFARKEKMSFEQSARHIRYDFFEKTAKKLKIKKLVLAHTKDDQVETVIMRVLRGTGIKGLSAIKTINKYNDLLVIRPLLQVEKNELLGYLKKNKISSRADKSNFEKDYFRNKIRLDIIPKLIKLSPSLKDNICRLALNAETVNDFLSSQVKSVYKKTVKRNGSGGLVLDIGYYLQQHVAIRAELVREVIFNLCGSLNNIDFKHIGIIDDFVNVSLSQGKALDLPNNIRLLKTRGKIRFFLDFNAEEKDGNKIKNKKEWKLECGQTLMVTDLGIEVSVKKVRKRSDLKKKPKHIEYIDFDKVRFPLVLRARKNGDVFFPLGAKGSKKLKSFLIDQKVDDEKKDFLPLIISEGKIAVVGFTRINEAFKVTGKTKLLLKIEFRKIK